MKDQNEVIESLIREAMHDKKLDLNNREKIWNNIRENRSVSAARGRRRHMEKIIAAYVGAAAAFVLSISVGASLWTQFAIGEQPVDTSEPVFTSSVKPPVTTRPSEESKPARTEPNATEPNGTGLLYRPDLYWAGTSSYRSYTGTVQVIIPGEKNKDDMEFFGSPWEKTSPSRKVVFWIRYNLFEYTEPSLQRVITKSFFDFTDSDEDLAFYNAEVEYFESLGIEVLKDHRCANGTPGQTNGKVPALVVAMNQEQYESLKPRLDNEVYFVVYGLYTYIAPTDTPDRIAVQRADEEWELDSHPYRSDVFWVLSGGIDFTVPRPGDIDVWINPDTLLSPSDRMAVRIRYTFYDADELALMRDPEGIIRECTDYLESLGIEVWEDIPPNLDSAKRGYFDLYVSATNRQLRDIRIDSNRLQSIEFYWVIYEEFASEFLSSQPDNPMPDDPTPDREVLTEQGLLLRLNEQGNAYTVVSIGSCIDREIAIPANVNGLPVTAIGEYAFAESETLVKITIPKGITEIGRAAFCDCSALEEIELPGSLKTIGKQAFLGCTGLTGITIPKSVTEIGLEALAYCTGLTTIEVEEGNTVYNSSGNCLIETEFQTLVAGCKTSVIPDEGVDMIGESAFYGQSGLTHITIPARVSYIQDFAFCGCEGLTEMILPEGLNTVYAFAFKDCRSLTRVHFSKSVMGVGYGIFSGCVSLTTITVDEENPYLSSTGNCLIGNNIYLEAGCGASVIPSDQDLEIIRGYAFRDLTNLTSIVIPENIKKIAGNAFDGCENLTDIYYCGTEEQWNGMGAQSSVPDGATVHFNYAG